MSLQGDLDLLGYDLSVMALPPPGSGLVGGTPVDDAALAADPMALAPGSSISQSQSVSTEGPNLDTFEALSTGKTAKGWDKKREDARGRRLDEGKALADNIRPGFDAAGAAVTAQGAAEQARAAEAAGDPAASGAAVDAAGKAIGLAPITSTGASAMAQAQAHVVAKEAEETAKALGKAEIARANYTQQIERIKATKLDPHQLFGKDPLAMALGNMTNVLMVMSGKPGVAAAGKMLNDNLMAAVERNVDSQIQNLQNQQKVAAGFEQIYNMVVDENDTAKQARDKVFGAYLAAVEGHIASQLGQHDSKIIGAETQKALAGLSMRRAETENQIYKDALDRGMDDAKLITQRELTYAQLSVEKARIAEAKAARQAEADAKKQAAADEKKTFAEQGAVFATSPDGGMRYQGQLRGIPGSSEWQKAAREVQTIQSEAATATESLKRIHDLNEKYRNLDPSTAAAMGFASLFDAKDSLKKEIAALSKTAAAKLANAMGMTPISDTDVKNMQEAVGEDNFVGHLVSGMGLNTSSAKATGQVLDLVTRNVNNKIKSYAEPGTAEDVEHVRQRYGEATLFEQRGARVPLPRAEPGGGFSVNYEYVPVADEDGNATPLAPGLAAQGDITKYQPNTAPGRKAEADAILNPKADDKVTRIVKDAAEYKPGDEVYKAKDKREAPSFYKAFVDDMAKSGMTRDSGESFDLKTVGGVGKGGIPVPNFADDIGDLAHLAFYGDGDEAEIAFLKLEDLSKRSDDVGNLADWAFKNKGAFDRKGTGRLTSEVDETEVLRATDR